MENTAHSSLHTEDDYSIISRNQPAQSFPHANQFDKDQNLLSGGDLEYESRSPVDGSCTRESEHLYSSHHALANAYEQIKIKYSDIDKKNKVLNSKLKASTSRTNSMNWSGTSQLMSSSLDNEVTKAWEAYSDKCKECEKLRDDLREAEQKCVKTKNAARDQSYREDLLRAHSQQDEVRKKLQQAELEIRDEKGKRALAREELQKEKDYHEMVLRATEKRHHEMDSTIANLQKALQEKNQYMQDLAKDMDNERKQAHEMLEKQKIVFKEQFHEMEGKLIREKEERTMLESQVTELEKWKKDVESFHISSGLPLAVPSALQNVWDGSVDSDNGSSCSDIEIVELVGELHTLTEELTLLKEQTSAQSSMLSRLCEDPKVYESLLSLSVNNFAETENVESIPIQCSETQPPISNPDSVQPSIDIRQLVSASSPPGSSDFSSRNSRDAASVVMPVTVSREIRAVPNNVQHVPRTNSPQRIVIPTFSSSISSAFNNIKQAKSGSLLHAVHRDEVSEQLSSYYSTVTDPVLTPSNRADNLTSKRPSEGSLSSDSGTGSSNIDTMVDPGSSDNRDRQASVFESTDDRLPLRYPPSNPFATNAKPGNRQGMRAVWPGASQGAQASDNATVLWPPEITDTSNSSPTSSFVVLPNEESLPPADQATATRSNQVREFEVQRVVRPVPREQTLPPNHPCNRPISRARPVGSSVTLPSQRRVNGANSRTEGQEETRAFMTAINPTEHICPVCDYVFPPESPESFMQRHINGHFSEDVSDTE